MSEPITELRTLQKSFTEHLRDPEHTPVPAGLDERRMGIYSELIFNNVSALLSDFFPVIKSILTEEQWMQMVRSFFVSHQSQTPYFMELSGEFVQYLSSAQLSSGFPDYLVQLAHYEWVELALYTMEAELPDKPLDPQKLKEGLVLSDLAQPLAYDYPVHRISPDFRPQGKETTLLLVSRSPDESVRFYELQPLSYQLLHEIQDNPGLIVTDWLNAAAIELAVDNTEEFIRNGFGLIESFNKQRMFTER